MFFTCHVRLLFGYMYFIDYSSKLEHGSRHYDRGQIYWSFASQFSHCSYYIFDTKNGVIDVHAPDAFVNEGDHLLVFSIMKYLWQRWNKVSSSNLNEQLRRTALDMSHCIIISR